MKKIKTHFLHATTSILLIFSLTSCLGKELIEEYLISVEIINNQKPIERMKFYFTDFDTEIEREYFVKDTIFIYRKIEIGQGYTFQYNYSNVSSFYQSFDVSNRLNVEIHVPGEAMRKEVLNISGRGLIQKLVIN